MGKIRKTVKKYLFLILSFVLFLCVFILGKIPQTARALAPVNAFYARTVGWLVSLIPFSLFGVVVCVAVVLFVLLLALFVRSKSKLKMLSIFLGIVFIILSLFPLSFGFSYYDKTVYDKLSMDVASQNDEQRLCEAIDYFTMRLNEQCQQIEFQDSHSVNPLTFEQLADIITQAYTSEKFDGISPYTVTPKRFFPSAYMNYLGITGMYFFLFAEANVCVNIPPRSLPYTMAHEMAHAKGVANEGEANFVAFMACVNSSHPFVRYSGLSAVIVNLINALYSVDKELYSQKKAAVDGRVFADISYSARFYEQFETWLEDIGTWVNDTYLKSNNVSDGVASYSQTVKGVLAYYEKYCT